MILLANLDVYKDFEQNDKKDDILPIEYINNIYENSIHSEENIAITLLNSNKDNNSKVQQEQEDEEN